MTHNWIPSAFVIVTMLLIAFNLIYRLGGEGVEVSGADVSFDREFDYQLHRVNVNHAFYIDNPNSAAIVRVRECVSV